MEKWDVYDKKRNKTGGIGIRGERLKKGEYHLVVFACIIGDDNKVLISQRAKNKTFPGSWEITGGSCLAGDSSEMGIIREIKEELGIDVNTREGKIIRALRDDKGSYFADIWLFHKNISLDQVVCQVEEVSDARFATLDEINVLIDKGIFIQNKFIVDVIRLVMVEQYFRSWIQVDEVGFENLLHKDILVKECTGDQYDGIDECKKWFFDWNVEGNRVNDWKIHHSMYDYVEDKVSLEWTFYCTYDFVDYVFKGASIIGFKDHRIISINEYKMED